MKRTPLKRKKPMARTKPLRPKDPKRSKRKAIRKKGPTRALRTKRMKKACHELWSKCVRARDKYRCVVCGTDKNLQAHHGIVAAGRSMNTRFEIDNGATLCYTDHIIKLHGYADAATWDAVRKFFIDTLGEDRYEEIKAAGKVVRPWKLEDFEQIHSMLGMQLAALETDL